MIKIIFVLLFAAAFCIELVSADWPMWRYDAERSAASPENLADNLELLWTRKLPPVRQAWPLEPNQRIDFDASYEPVVMGKLLFLGSPNDGSVTAYSTGTGEEKWKFYTEGPVRCAPACWSSTVRSASGGNKIIFGSDDGYLYCLEALTGKLLWKFRAAPEDRADRRQLGNDHLVSLWPIRGGPVIRDGIVYFGSGIWPIFGIFLYALDIETGKIKWTNPDLNYIIGTRHMPETGFSPQGSLGLIRNRLVVPNGRALPGVLDADTGKLIQFWPGGRKGECRIALQGNYAFVGEHAVMDLDTGCEVATRHAATYAPYKLVPGCNASSAFENGISYGAAKGIFYSYDMNNVKAGERDIEQNGQIQKNVFRWEPPLRWEFKTQYKEEPKISKIGGRPVLFSHIYSDFKKSSIVIKAGKRIYGHVEKTLICLKDLDGAPSIAWEKSLDAIPISIIAADEKLFVASSDGTICCFGVGSAGKTYDCKPVALEEKNDSWAEKTKAVINASGVKSGYCLVLGLKDGRLIEELLKQTNLIVLAVDPDMDKINALKRRFDKSGLLGSRVEFFTSDPFAFLFPPYIANLAVSENEMLAEQIGKTDFGKLFNSLRPYGGTFCLEMPDNEYAIFESKLKSANLAKAVVKRNANLSLLVREGSLPGAEPWSHMSCDAANTFCSKDDLVKAPLGFLWYGDVPTGTPGQWHTIINMTVNGGRVFQSNGATVLAYDGYTGRFLWSKALPGRHGWSALAAMPDNLYFAISDKCFVIAPETGEILKEFKLNIGATQMAVDLRVFDNFILAMCREQKDPARGPYYRTMSELGSVLICLDRETGAELWRREAKERFHSHAVAMGDGMVFCVDSIHAPMAEKALPANEKLKEMESTLLALDARTGNLVWSEKIIYDATRNFTKEEFADAFEDAHVPRLEADDWLAYSSETGLVVTVRFLTGTAWNAKTGKKIWDNKRIRGTAPLMLRGKTLVTSGGDEYDLSTGEMTNNFKSIRKRSCNYAIASKHLIFIRGAGEAPVTCSAAYFDVEQNKAYRLRNIRSSCRNNQISGDGILNSPCYTPGDCICNYPIQTSFGMVHMPEVEEWAGKTPLPNPQPHPAAAPIKK